MKHKPYGPLWQLRQLRRGKVHAGYTWAAIMADCEIVCENCVTSEYEAIFKATYSPKTDEQWECVGITNSGESEHTEICAHCNKVIWEAD